MNLWPTPFVNDSAPTPIIIPQKSKADNIKWTHRSHVIDAIPLSRIPPKIASPIIWGTVSRGIVTAATVHFSGFKIQTTHSSCLITAD